MKNFLLRSHPLKHVPSNLSLDGSDFPVHAVFAIAELPFAVDITQVSITRARFVLTVYSSRHAMLQGNQNHSSNAGILGISKM